MNIYTFVYDHKMIPDTMIRIYVFIYTCIYICVYIYMYIYIYK